MTAYINADSRKVDITKNRLTVKIINKIMVWFKVDTTFWQSMNKFYHFYFRLPYHLKAN